MQCTEPSLRSEAYLIKLFNHDLEQNVKNISEISFTINILQRSTKCHTTETRELSYKTKELRTVTNPIDNHNRIYSGIISCLS
jgi:hypothetical protein